MRKTKEGRKSGLMDLSKIFSHERGRGGGTPFLIEE